MSFRLTAWVFSVAVVAGTLPFAGAATMNGRAFEPFDYPSASSPSNELIFQNNFAGGWGWNSGGDNKPNDPWSLWGGGIALPASSGTTAGKIVAEPGLTYSAAGYPAPTGSKATITADSSNNQVSRYLGQHVDSGTFYFSYLTDRNNDTQRSAVFSLHGPANGIAGTPGNTAERFAIGQVGSATAGTASSAGNIALQFNNSNPNNYVPAAAPIPYGIDVTHLIVGRVDFNPMGNDTFRLYVDPTDMTVEPTTPYIETSGFEITSFNSVRLFTGNAATVQGVPQAAASVDFDELRFGRSWNDLIATAPAPPTYAYTSIDYPGATKTIANGIAVNDGIVGEYEDSGGVTHAFIRTAAGAYSSFDHPTAVGYTSANGLNSSGQIAGLYSLDDQVTMRAYLRTGNTYLDLVPRPASTFTQATSLNEAGHVVGSFLDASLNAQGFLFDGTTYTTLSAPGALLTVPLGINNSDWVAGNAVINNANRGFLLKNGTYTILNVPGSSSTVAEGINDQGQVTGLYTAGGIDHGFVYEDGSYSRYDYPDAGLTWGFAMNNSEKIVGYYEGIGGHGFLRSPILEADFDSDGDVDAGDLAAWTTNFGLTVGVDKAKGDADLDGDVDGGDLLIWQRQFKPAPATTIAATGVPEPDALALIGLGSVTLFATRRKTG